MPRCSIIPGGPFRSVKAGKRYSSNLGSSSDWTNVAERVARGVRVGTAEGVSVGKGADVGGSVRATIGVGVRIASSDSVGVGMSTGMTLGDAVRRRESKGVELGSECVAPANVAVTCGTANGSGVEKRF